MPCIFAAEVASTLAIGPRASQLTSAMKFGDRHVKALAPQEENIPNDFHLDPFSRESFPKHLQYT
jgi:hypothetical protein